MAIVLLAAVTGGGDRTFSCPFLFGAEKKAAHFEARCPAPDSLIRHSDRGVQYACAGYSEILAARGIRASMSRIGNPYDDAKAAESFMKTLKHEEVEGRTYSDARHHARGTIGTFIEECIIASACTRLWPIGRRPSSKPNTRPLPPRSPWLGITRHAEIYGDAR
jgi:transposase InsO family protein